MRVCVESSVDLVVWRLKRGDLFVVVKVCLEPANILGCATNRRMRLQCDTNSHAIENLLEIAH